MMGSTQLGLGSSMADSIRVHSGPSANGWVQLSKVVQQRLPDQMHLRPMVDLEKGAVGGGMGLGSQPFQAFILLGVLWALLRMAQPNHKWARWEKEARQGRWASSSKRWARLQ